MSAISDVGVNFKMDGDEIAQRTKARVIESIEVDKDRNRGNANDQPLMAN